MNWTKHDEETLPTSTWNKIGDDEPVFILRAQDLTAPVTIYDWVIRNPQISAEKKLAALRCSQAMVSWQMDHLAKAKKPD